MISYTYKRRVRYGECDPMGVVYHAHYLNFFEEARTEAMRQWGVVYKDLEERGIILPVVDIHIKYTVPAEYDEELYVRTWVEKAPMVKLETKYEAWVIRDDEKVAIVKGEIVLAFVSKDQRKPIRAPEEVLKLFK